METIGIMATVVVVASVVVGAAIAVRSLPDLAHYRRLRNM